jgi:hypothetical protein
MVAPRLCRSAAVLLKVIAAACAFGPSIARSEDFECRLNYPSGWHVFKLQETEGVSILPPVSNKASEHDFRVVVAPNSLPARRVRDQDNEILALEPPSPLVDKYIGEFAAELTGDPQVKGEELGEFVVRSFVGYENSSDIVSAKIKIYKYTEFMEAKVRSYPVISIDEPNEDTLYHSLDWSCSSLPSMELEDFTRECRTILEMSMMNEDYSVESCESLSAQPARPAGTAGGRGDRVVPVRQSREGSYDVPPAARRHPSVSSGRAEMPPINQRPTWDIGISGCEASRGIIEDVAKFFLDNNFTRLRPLTITPQRRNYYSDRDTVFLYSRRVEPAARAVARNLSARYNRNFVVRYGAGAGLNEALRDRTLFVHVIDRTCR